MAYLLSLYLLSLFIVIIFFILIYLRDWSFYLLRCKFIVNHFYIVTDTLNIFWEFSYDWFSDLNCHWLYDKIIKYMSIKIYAKIK